MNAYRSFQLQILAGRVKKDEMNLKWISMSNKPESFKAVDETSLRQDVDEIMCIKIHSRS